MSTQLSCIIPVTPEAEGKQRCVVLPCRGLGTSKGSPLTLPGRTVGGLIDCLGIKAFRHCRPGGLAGFNFCPTRHGSNGSQSDVALKDSWGQGQPAQGQWRCSADVIRRRCILSG